MWKSVVTAAYAVLVAAMSPATAGEWQYDPDADLILYESVPVMPWYRQQPWAGTGPGYYYSRHPDHIPAYPRRLTGYPVPIYQAPPRLPAPAMRVMQMQPSHHAAWCAERYRSYDVRTDSWQPYHGSRRLCRSPFR